MANYTSQYSGQQIDKAIGAAQSMGDSSGILKSNGAGTVSAAAANVDYQKPIAGTLIEDGEVFFLDANGAVRFYIELPVYDDGSSTDDEIKFIPAEYTGFSTSDDSEFPPVGVTGAQVDIGLSAGLGARTATGLLKSDGEGTVTAAVAGTDYQLPIDSMRLEDGVIYFLDASEAVMFSIALPVYEEEYEAPVEEVSEPL